MSAEAAALVRTWSVGSRTVTLTVQRARPGQMLSACIEWAPDEPQRLNAAELAEYRAGRNAALAELAREMGIRVAVLEANP